MFGITTTYQKCKYCKRNMRKVDLSHHFGVESPFRKEKPAMLCEYCDGLTIDTGPDRGE